MEVGVQQAQEVEIPKRIATEAFMAAAAAVARLDKSTSATLRSCANAARPI